MFEDPGDPRSSSTLYQQMFGNDAGRCYYTEYADAAIEALLSGRYDGPRTVDEYSEDRFYLPLRDAPVEENSRTTTEEKLYRYFETTGWPYDAKSERERIELIERIEADHSLRMQYLWMIRQEEG